jgi:hypothetical protein
VFHQQVAAPERGKLDPAHGTFACVGNAVCDLERESRLAAPPRSRHGQKASVGQELPDLANLRFSTDERVQQRGRAAVRIRRTLHPGGILDPGKSGP